MVDTPRTLAALQALFADNTTGDISPQDLRDFLVSVMGRTKSVYLPAKAFEARTGSSPTYASQGADGNYHAWALDASSAETVQARVSVPDDFTGSTAITFYLEHTNLGAGSGNVRWRVAYLPDTDAGDYDGFTGYVELDQTVAAPLQDIKKVTTFTSASFLPAVRPSNFLLAVTRVAADAADTLANDAGFVGIWFSYTAEY